MTESVAAARACGKLILSGWDAGGVDRGADQGVDGLVDREQRPHLLGDALGVFAAQHRLARAHVGLVVSDHRLAAPAHRVGAGQVQRRVGLDVEQVGDQANTSEESSSSAVGSGAGVHGVLDDPHGDRRPVGLATRVQQGQVAAVGQHGDGGQPERRRGPPQDVRPGGQHVAGQGVGQKVAVGQHQHPRAERGQQVAGQGLLADACRRRSWPRPAPRCPTRPRQPTGPAGTPRPGWHSRAGRSARRFPSSRARRWWSRPSTPPAARSRTPRPRPSAPTGPATWSNSMCSGSAPSRVRARASEEMFGGRHRRPAPASTQPSGSSTPPSNCSPRRR